jgi:Outer membrane protein beta-barrel domain
MLIDTIELVSFPNGAVSPNQVEQYNLLSPRRLYPQLANKSMLVTNYIEIPLEFRFDTRPEDIARSFNVAIGGRVGYLFDSFTKVRYKNNGETVKVKDKYDHGLNSIRYGVYTRIGIGGFNWFAFYNLSEMFEKNKGPHGAAINTITAGISINGF